MIVMCDRSQALPLAMHHSKDFLLLVRGKLWFRAELNTPFLRFRSAPVRPRQDPDALVLRHGGQERQNAFPKRRCQVKPLRGTSASRQRRGRPRARSLISLPGPIPRGRECLPIPAPQSPARAEVCGFTLPSGSQKAEAGTRQRRRSKDSRQKPVSMKVFTCCSA